MATEAEQLDIESPPKGSPSKAKRSTTNEQPFYYPKGMPKSVNHILCSSKATAMRDLHHSHNMHVERLKNMKPHIDMTLNKGFKMNNAKKEQEAAERNATIERENKLLLTKMYSIMNAENPYLKLKAEPGQKSLNTEKRRQEYDRIARENQAIMQRILQRGSNFDVRKLDQEWKQTQKTLRAIAQEPWVLDSLSPSRRKLDPLDAASIFGLTPNPSAEPLPPISPTKADGPAPEPEAPAPEPEAAPEPAAEPEAAAGPESAADPEVAVAEEATAEEETPASQEVPAAAE